MDLFEAVEIRASVRAFHRQPINDVSLIKILDAGRRAPSGYNLQPWEFIVVRDRKILTKLGKIQSCIAQAEVAIGVVIDEKSTKIIEDIDAWYKSSIFPTSSEPSGERLLFGSWRCSWRNRRANAKYTN